MTRPGQHNFGANVAARPLPELNMSRTLFLEREATKNGADGQTRTADRRFTKPLLYQLSYVG